MMRRLLIGLVKGYRLLLSPWLGASCRFEPTCSVYSIQALEQHGAGAGSWLTVARLARCQPWCQGGHDPVPTELPRASRLFSRLVSPADLSSTTSSSSSSSPMKPK